jgi:hypothetical protein
MYGNDDRKHKTKEVNGLVPVQNLEAFSRKVYSNLSHAWWLEKLIFQ